jgi:hypothetical protein
MRSPTFLHENRTYGPQKFSSPVQNDFCNTIPPKADVDVPTSGLSQAEIVFAIVSCLRGGKTERLISAKIKLLNVTGLGVVGGLEVDVDG